MQGVVKAGALTHRYFRFHSMMAMQREQQPDVAGIAAITAVFLELGWCLKPQEFWCRGRGPLAPCERGPCEVIRFAQPRQWG